MEKNYKLLIRTLESTMKTNKWVEINDNNYYYIPEDGAIIPNPQKIPMRTDKFVSLPDMECEKMQSWFVKKWFVDNTSDNPLIENDEIKYTAIGNIPQCATYVYCGDSGKSVRIIDGYTVDWVMADAYSIKIPLYKLNQTEEKDVLLFLIKKKLNVFKDDDQKKLFFLFTRLNDLDLMKNNENKRIFEINDSKKYNTVVDELNRIGKPFDPDSSDEKETLLANEYCLGDDLLKLAKAELLNCDQSRVHMDSYPEHILHDPQSGHWELWDDGNSDKYVNISSSLVARNPVFDALNNKSGAVGIDFGTKSTVVTYRHSTADVLPMRIGSGQFSRAVSKDDYENPTVMELRNVEKFVAAYKKYEGRPDTCWEDLLISHEAAQQLKSEESEGDTFSSFFSELKQWANDKNMQVLLRDRQGKEVNIPTYISLDDDFDPIEIYAYYLGLFINNMDHKLFLRYKLSFPATMEKAVRDKILNSFTKGIKKSLPIQVINDDTCMKIFKVEHGASEPAAYAITALYGYGFDPEEDEKYYYGIFDFGGGTTDFDFGVWSSEDDEPENYDYKISHFGQGGDPYLGGEKLLDILAYQVFINNYAKLLAEKIVFIRPFGEKEISGKDYLVRQDSQHAHFNQKRLMEKLRGVWENDKETRKNVEGGKITLSLFTMEGEQKSNVALDVNLNELDSILEAKIDKGVAQFFEAFKNCFLDDSNIKYIYDVNNGFNIFLAGNSSKSPLVYKVFKKYIDLTEKPEWFKVYPPLGTELSDKILNGELEPNIDLILAEIDSNVKDNVVPSNNQDEIDLNTLTKPTGKTGVAFGLLNNRVRVVQNEAEEIGFRYYIGQNRKQKFYCSINKDNQKYNVWKKFCTASRDEFDIWFTRSPAAPSNELPINQIGIHSELGVIAEPSSDKSVFIRLVSPTDIEYIVATDDEITSSSYDVSGIERVSLQEKQ